MKQWFDFYVVYPQYIVSMAGVTREPRFPVSPSFTCSCLGTVKSIHYIVLLQELFQKKSLLVAVFFYVSKLVHDSAECLALSISVSLLPTPLSTNESLGAFSALPVWLVTSCRLLAYWENQSLSKAAFTWSRRESLPSTCPLGGLITSPVPALKVKSFPTQSKFP